MAAQSEVILKESPDVNLEVFKDNDWAGFFATLLDTNDAEFNLTNSTLSAEVCEEETVITAMEVEVVEPPSEGTIMLWMTAAQTALLVKTLAPSEVHETCSDEVFAYTPYSYSVEHVFFDQASSLSSMKYSNCARLF